MTARIAGLCVTARINRPVNAGRKNPALNRPRRQLRHRLFPHPHREVRRRFARRQSLGDPLPDAIAKKIPSRVIGSTRPAASPISAHRGPASSRASKSCARERGDRPRVRLQRRAARDPRRGDPRRGARAQLGGADPGIRLRADADREMPGPRKRPDVAGRIADQLDHDLAAGDAMREEACGDRQLIAAERRRQAPADQAVGAVGADHEGAAMCAAIARVVSVTSPAAADIRDPCRNQRRAGVLGRLQQRRVERGAVGHDQRARRSSGTPTSRSDSELRPELRPLGPEIAKIWRNG